MSNVETAVGVLALVLLFVSSFLAMAETSLSRIDRFRAQALAEEGRRGSIALTRLVHSPERFSGYLNSVLLLLLASRVVTATAVAYLAFHWFSTPGFVLVVIAEIAVAYVFAEAMPKTYAVQHTERAALLCAPIISGLARIIPMRAITRPLIWSANVLLPGKGLAQGPFVYEQQILALADTAAEEKLIEHDEHRLIHSVIEFGTTIAREVMVPRTDMITVPASSTASEAIDLAIAHGFSRMPVHANEEHDRILGILFTKDLLQAIHHDRGDALVESLVRPAKYIPETKRVAELMKEMRLEKVHMVIAVDEYGTVVGLVTLEDLIEEVVGEIADEYDVDEQPSFERINEEEWRIDARMPIDEVFEKTGIRLPHGDWDTVGGLLINAFGRVPNKGETTSVDDYDIVVEQTSGRRITRVRVKVVEPATEEESNVHAS